MNRKRTVDGDGFASGFIRWSFGTSLNPAGTQCRLTGVRVSLAQSYTMPRWRTHPRATYKVRATWNRFLARLWVHERGHGRISFTAASNIERQLVLMRRSSCDRLVRDASAAANARVRQQSAQQVAYDARTGHGATQGAVFG